MSVAKGKKQGRESLLQIYAQHTKKYPWLFVLLVVATVAMQAAELAAPLQLKTFFNILTQQDPSQTVMNALLITLGLYAGLEFASWCMRRVQNFTIYYIESRVMTDLTASAFKYLLGHSYNFFTSNFGGTLTHRVNRFSRGYEIIMDSIMLQFMPTALFVMGAVVILFLNNKALGLMLLVWVVLFVMFQFFVARWRQPFRALRAEEESKVTGVIADSIGNQMTISLFAGAPAENSRLREAVLRWRAATIREWTVDEWIWAAQGFLMILINVALLYGAVRYWSMGLLTIGDFVLIQAYLLTTFERLVGINREFRRFYNVYADANEMVTVLNTPHEVQNRRGGKELSVREAFVEFRDVDFYFKAERPVLTRFNLAIRGGEKIALVGPSGAGKSTVTKLLLRLFDVKGGSIEIDGQNIAHVPQDTLREAIGYVPQEPVLFHRTLMENIRYGRRDATDEEVLDAAKKAHCHEFIMAQPGGYDAFVGERGIKLSGGERQRVAIARAILKNAPILVLDEATSSLDSESEALIQDALETLMKGKTVVVIAHRLSTIMKMDRIVVMEEGRVIAQGTHLELIRQKGLYQKLWSIQAGGFLGDGDKPKSFAEDEGFLEEDDDEAEAEKTPHE